jgi:hypothetical protein
MLASRNVGVHLVRGLVAAALIAWALLHQVTNPVLAAAAGGLALVAMRGCPLCWTVGLFATIGEVMAARRGRTGESRCRSCS